MTTVNACSYNQLFHDAENSSVVGKLLYEKAFIISWIYNSQVNIEKKNCEKKQGQDKLAERNCWKSRHLRQFGWTKKTGVN